MVARDDTPGEKRLGGDVVGEKTAVAEVLRARLPETLPEYMVPAACVRLEQFPLTPNGEAPGGASVSASTPPAPAAARR